MKSTRGFASMSEEKKREIARRGGMASGGNFKNNRERAREAGKKGGQLQGKHNNPANFANDRTKASSAGRIGGKK